MKCSTRSSTALHESLCVVLAFAITTAPAANALAQTNAAAQAVRQRVSGLGAAEDPHADPTAPASEQPPAPEQAATSSTPPLTEPSAGKIDTTFVSPTAIAVVVLRPAQLLKSPLAELLPTEVATAAGMQYAGFDPANVDEVIGFVEMPPNNYGLTFKFNTPFRGSSIAPQMRPMVQLSELAGRKYLQSGHPMMPSFYGTNKQTLVAAPDAVMRQLVESSGQPRSGVLLDRIKDEPSGSDLYLAVDFATLRPFIQMGLTPEVRAKVPPEAQPVLDALNHIAAINLTVNMTHPGPTSLVLHANDEAAAQQLETIAQGLMQKLEAEDTAQVSPDDPIGQAVLQYRSRITKPFVPQRIGTSLRVVYIDGQNPTQQQFVGLALLGLGVSFLQPAIQAAQRNAAAQGMPPTDGVAPPTESPPTDQP